MTRGQDEPIKMYAIENQETHQRLLIAESSKPDTITLTIDHMDPDLGGAMIQLTQRQFEMICDLRYKISYSTEPTEKAA